MKKGNIVDLIAYQNEHQKIEHAPISKELEDAIESLILQLREKGPLENNSSS